MISSIVYLLCAVTSVVCTGLLFYNYRRNKTRLLFWSAVCFLGLSLNNILLFVDLVLTAPTIDLSAARAIPAALGFTALVSCFAWDML